MYTAIANYLGHKLASPASMGWFIVSKSVSLPFVSKSCLTHSESHEEEVRYTVTVIVPLDIHTTDTILWQQFRFIYKS